MNQTYRRTGTLLGLATLTFMLGLASPPSADAFHKNRGNVVQMLERDGRFTTLLTALELTDLKETVASANPITLFAPTDAAFAALPEGTLEELIANPEVLSTILLYHVVGDTRSLWDLIQESSVTTLQGDPVIVQRELYWKLTVNGTDIIGLRPASNGTILVINGVLLPPEEPVTVESLVDVLALDGRFTTLLTALELTGLDEVVASAEDLTIFAPTDEAFAALPEGTLEALIADPETLANILTYHVVGESLNAWQLLRERHVETLQGSDVDISLAWTGLFINDSQVINPNIGAPNGIIHSINAVLLPPEPVENVVGLLQADGRFNTLLAAVEAAGLAETLATGGPFTIFAPTDEAFAALPEGTVEALLADIPALTDILLYHVVDGAKSASELLDEGSVETLQGSSVHVRRFFKWVFVNKSLVLDADLESPNATVHAIANVLLPPSDE